VLAAAAATFVLLRSAVHLLGDGYLYIRELDHDAWAQGPRVDRAPLTFWIVHHLHVRLAPLGTDGETLYRALSVVSGLLYLVAAAGLAAHLAVRRHERLALWALLATGGHVALFFGYAENYGLLVLALTLYFICGLRAAAGRTGAWLPALALGVLLTLHFSFAALLPSLLALLALDAARAPRARAVAKAAGAALLVPAVAGGILLAVLPDPLALFRGVNRANNFLPLLAAPGQAQHYRLLAPGHALDLANLVFLAVPGALLSLAAGRPRDGREPAAIFLATAALFPLLLAAVLNPEVGFFRDWDVLAVLLFPLTVWAGRLLVRNAAVPGFLADAALLIAGASALHTALWVGVNAGAGPATARFRDLLEGATLSRHARSYGWETLGSLYDRTGRPDEALAAFEEANRASAGNPRHWISLGALHMDAGRYEEAVRAFARAIEKAPERAEAYLGLARVYLRWGKPGEALLPLERARLLAPDDAQVWFETGNAWFDLGENEQAALAYGRAGELAPRFAAARANRAAALYGMGRHEEALRAAGEALTVRPDLPEALYIQGASLWALGRRVEARERFRRLLETAPEHPKAAEARRLLDS
jgi:tetratricopeptide (TPR) repeat protein